MKNLFMPLPILLSLLLLIALSAIGQKKASGSLSDTLQWLSDSTASQTSKSGGVKFTFRAKNPNGCSVVLEEHFEQDKYGSPEHTEKTIFSLTDIDPDSIRVGGSRPEDRKSPTFLRPTPDEVWFDTTNHTKTIIRGGSNSGESRADAAIRFNDTFAPEFVVQLKRAVELCKALPSDRNVADDSLSDTLRWLTDTTSRQTADEGKVNFKLKSEGPNGCSVVLEENSQEDETSKSTTITSFSLADLDPDSIHVGGPQDPAIPGIFTPSPNYVLLHTTNFVENIIRTRAPFPPDSRGETILRFDVEFASDFVARLKRASALCGGKKTSSPLPKFVREFDTPTATSAPIPSAQPLTDADIDTKYYRVIPRLNYRLCKEVGRDVKLEGGSFFQRTEAGGGLLYVVGTYPDGVFWKTSAASAHVKILEVPKEFANTECPSLESAFATVVEQGPTYGWYKTERYLAYKNPSGEGESRTVDVKAPEGTDDVYCTHKFVLGSRIGDTSYGLLSWTPTKMVMSVRAKTVPGGPGAHINLTLYVRYLPREDREKFADKFGCTANFPPQYSDPQNNFQQPSQRDFPDGSSMFVVP